MAGSLMMAADLDQLVADYLGVRRALGFKLRSEGPIPVRYVAFLRVRGRDQQPHH